MAMVLRESQDEAMTGGGGQCLPEALCNRSPNSKTKRTQKSAKAKGKRKAKAKAAKAKAAKAKAAKPAKLPQAAKRKTPRAAKRGPFRFAAKPRAPRGARAAGGGVKRKAEAVKDEEWDCSSENRSPNPSDVEKLLGGPSKICENMSIWIAKQLSLDAGCVAGAVQLFQEGSTLPFIARYRKERTGSMMEDDLRRIEREITRIKELEKRRGRVAMALNRGRNLTPKVQDTLLQAESLEELEELWAPFRQKRQTRAQMAKAKGLEPLAAFLEESAKGEMAGSATPTVPVVDLCHDSTDAPQTAMAALAAAGDLPPAEAAAQFLGKDVPDVAAALAAARDILAEQLAHRPDLRQVARDMLAKRVTLTSRRRNDGSEDGQRFKTYWEFDAHMQQVKPHQFLAIQRGEAAKCLSIAFVVSPEDVQLLIDRLIDSYLGKQASSRQTAVADAPTPLRAASVARVQAARQGAYQREIRAAMEDGFKRLMLPSLQREWRRKLKERAEDEAFDTFGRNLKKKLLSQPLRLHPCYGDGGCTAIIGVDPAFRTGCKCALISLTGQVLATKTIFPHPPQSAGHAAVRGLNRLLEQAMLEGADPETATESGVARVVCSIGNGTASRETEAWLRQHFSDAKGLGYAIVDEAGASVYSASPLAAAELPDLDVCLRGAVSIGRRLLDPLAELVKIDPRSIGVGLYQHDVDQKRLAEELRGATMSCVNLVGVDLNTASVALLEHVAGLNARLARSILTYREEHGGFKTRRELLKIKGFGPKSFQQAAGFLRIFGGSEPLDALPIHPESYAVAKSLMIPPDEPPEVLAEQFEVGIETIRDICSALSEGAKSDPRRQEAPLRIKEPGKTTSQVGSNAIDAQEAGITASQLKPQMRLLGVVKNVVAFGAFVDIGVGSDGLLHISNYPPQLRPNGPSVNDQLEVTIVSAESRQERGKEKWRIGLSMK